MLWQLLQRLIIMINDEAVYSTETDNFCAKFQGRGLSHPRLRQMEWTNYIHIEVQEQCRGPLLLAAWKTGRGQGNRERSCRPTATANNTPNVLSDAPCTGGAATQSTTGSSCRCNASEPGCQFPMIFAHSWTFVRHLSIFLLPRKPEHEAQAR